ncbi:hypothetical protein [Methylobacterium sp. Leaf111]|uniref:hypothetical protein n=1 Tax=Methylobacterium sp. Leaf111 TaxID=1736257 RepID=UPI000AA657B5|nr:hypothetical protein [Methylobacterium sp. Leaf111]
MTAIIRGTSASEIFTPTYQEGSNPFGIDSSLTYGNGGDDTFNLIGRNDSYLNFEAIAGSGNDTFNGTFGNGNIYAGAGNDTFNLHSGSYNYDADAGNDTIAFDAQINSYFIAPAGVGVTIQSNNVFVQTANVEVFKFTDVTVNQADGNNSVDDLFYLSRYGDVATAGIDPETHYAQYGWHEGRDPNLFFDTQGYLNAYKDVAAAAINPLEHYLTNGWKEGRDPSGLFDTKAYLAANPDVAAAGVNPLQHYLDHGVNEGRAIVSDGAFFV